MTRRGFSPDEVSPPSISGKLVVSVEFLGCCLAAVFAILTRGSFDAKTLSAVHAPSHATQVITAEVAAPRFFLPSSDGQSEYGPNVLGSITILGFFDGCNSACVADISALGKSLPSFPIRVAAIDTSNQPPSSSQLVADLVSAKLPPNTRHWTEYGGDSAVVLGVIRQYEKLANLADVNDTVFCIDGRGDVRLDSGVLSASFMTACASLARSAH